MGVVPLHDGHTVVEYQIKNSRLLLLVGQFERLHDRLRTLQILGIVGLAFLLFLALVGVGFVEPSPRAARIGKVLFALGLIDLEDLRNGLHRLAVDRLATSLLQVTQEHLLILGRHVRHNRAVALHREGHLADRIFVKDLLDLLVGQHTLQPLHQALTLLDRNHAVGHHLALDLREFLTRSLVHLGNHGVGVCVVPIAHGTAVVEDRRRSDTDGALVL